MFSSCSLTQITVFRLKEGAELDQSILSALLHSHRISDAEKLSLALTWNRVDIARSHVFNEDVEWPSGRWNRVYIARSHKFNEEVEWPSNKWNSLEHGGEYL